MAGLSRFYRLLNILSIDVALGAVCCAAWFAKFFEVELRIYALACLGLTVWIIYSADHLLDARKVKGDASMLRHKFHQDHFKEIIIAWVIVGTLDFVLLFFLRAQVLHAGTFLICIVVIYLLINRWLTFLKEIAVAALYCGGVLLPAFSLKESPLIVPELCVMLCFFLTALINVVMFAWFDHELDAQDGNNSFSIKFGKAFTWKLLVVLFGAQLVLLFALLTLRIFIPAFLLGVMSAILLLLFSRSDKFGKAEYYRLLGDAVFLIPAIFLLI